MIAIYRKLYVAIIIFRIGGNGYAYNNNHHVAFGSIRSIYIIADAGGKKVPG